MLNATMKLPDTYHDILNQSQAIHFSMPSDVETGCLLRLLAASKPGGLFLDIGTGTGLSLSWLADGADLQSVIISIDNNEEYQEIAQSVFKDDERISMVRRGLKATRAYRLTWFLLMPGPVNLIV